MKYVYTIITNGVIEVPDDCDINDHKVKIEIFNDLKKQLLDNTPSGFLLVKLIEQQKHEVINDR